MSGVVFLVLIVVGIQLSASRVTVLVDPTGGDDSNCQSVQDLQATTSTISAEECKSIDRALGGQPGAVFPCNSLLSCVPGVQERVVDRALVQLADGEHRLNGKRDTPMN